jgi:hypothetical protein
MESQQSGLYLHFPRDDEARTVGMDFLVEYTGCKFDGIDHEEFMSDERQEYDVA